MHCKRMITHVHICISTSLRRLLLFFVSQDAFEAKRSGRSFVRNCNTAKWTSTTQRPKKAHYISFPYILMLILTLGIWLAIIANPMALNLKTPAKNDLLNSACLVREKVGALSLGPTSTRPLSFPFINEFVGAFHLVWRCAVKETEVDNPRVWLFWEEDPVVTRGERANRGDGRALISPFGLSGLGICLDWGTGAAETPIFFSFDTLPSKASLTSFTRLPTTSALPNATAIPTRGKMPYPSACPKESSHKKLSDAMGEPGRSSERRMVRDRVTKMGMWAINGAHVVTQGWILCFLWTAFWALRSWTQAVRAGKQFSTWWKTDLPSKFNQVFRVSHTFFSRFFRNRFRQMLINRLHFRSNNTLHLLCPFFLPKRNGQGERRTHNESEKD